MGLQRYIARRVVYTVIILLVIVTFNFVLFQVIPFRVACPGASYTQCAQTLYVPPAPARSGNTTALIEHERAEVMAAYGFDKPIWTRFVLYFYNMFTGQYGFNIGGSLGGPVLQTIEQRVPYTVLLIGASTVAAYIIGIGVGVVSAARRGKILDVTSLSVLLFINALPVFFLGGILIVLQILTTGIGYHNVGSLIVAKTGWSLVSPVLQALWLPFLTLTLAGVGGVYLTMRATMIDAISEDYVVMARARGLDERTVLYRHAFRNAILPLVTLFALSIGFILAGAIITETVFDWPGLGIATYIGVVTNDFPLEQAIFFIISTMVLLANFLVDIAYGFLDPRIRAG